MVGVMLALGVSQLVAEKIVAPIDDIMIELSGLPFLHEEPPLKFQALVARDVMQGDVVSLSDVSRVRDVVSMLDKTEHNGFPVTTRDEDGKMCGIILRRQLYLLLLRRLWTHEMYSHELKELKRQSVHYNVQRLGPRAVVGYSAFHESYSVHSLTPVDQVYRLFHTCATCLSLTVNVIFEASMVLSITAVDECAHRSASRQGARPQPLNLNTNMRYAHQINCSHIISLPLRRTCLIDRTDSVDPVSRDHAAVQRWGLAQTAAGVRVSVHESVQLAPQLSRGRPHPQKACDGAEGLGNFRARRLAANYARTAQQWPVTADGDRCSDGSSAKNEAASRVGGDLVR
eukprot:5390090-Prymnesium_polylepis.1